jgi:hypothetical protein
VATTRAALADCAYEDFLAANEQQAQTKRD